MSGYRAYTRFLRRADLYQFLLEECCSTCTSLRKWYQRYLLYESFRNDRVNTACKMTVVHWQLRAATPTKNGITCTHSNAVDRRDGFVHRLCTLHWNYAEADAIWHWRSKGKWHRHATPIIIKMAHKFKPSEYPRPFPSYSVPMYSLLPGANVPIPAPDPVGHWYSPTDTTKRESRLPAPDLLDPIDYPEKLHPSYYKPAYNQVTHPPLY